MKSPVCERCGGAGKLFVMTVRGRPRTFDAFTCAVRAAAEHLPEGAPMSLEKPAAPVASARRRGDVERGGRLPVAR